MVSLLLCGCAAIALAAAAPVSLNSGRIQVTFGERGISAVGMLPAPPKGRRSAQDEGHGVAPLWSVDVVGDDFSVSALVGPANSNTTGKLMTIRSSGLAAPSVTSSSDTNVTFTWRCGTALSCNVLYSLPFGATSVTKSVSVHHTTTAGAADAAGGGTASATATANVWNVTDVAVFADVSLTLAGSSSADTITSCSHYVRLDPPLPQHPHSRALLGCFPPAPWWAVGLRGIVSVPQWHAAASYKYADVRNSDGCQHITRSCVGVG